MHRTFSIASATLALTTTSGCDATGRWELTEMDVADRYFGGGWETPLYTRGAVVSYGVLDVRPGRTTPFRLERTYLYVGDIPSGSSVEQFDVRATEITPRTFNIEATTTAVTTEQGYLPVTGPEVGGGFSLTCTLGTPIIDREECFAEGWHTFGCHTIDHHGPGAMLACAGTIDDGETQAFRALFTR